jgi:mono/diheme cytochrome c family protein
VATLGTGPAEAGSLAPVLIATLSAAQKAGIAGMGAAFMIFALVSSFVIPRYRPNFPGRRVWPYVGLVVCFFVAMMVVVVFVGREKSEAKAESTTAPAATTLPPGPPPPAVTGDAVAGKALFAPNACATCHTFKPAGATATIGPDLDQLAADAQTANRGSLVQYTTESIVNPNAYVVPKFPANVMPKDFGTKLTKKQIDDLVAFLLKPA